MSVGHTELLDKIKGFYPQLEQYGITLDVAFDETKKAWTVSFVKGEHVQKTHIEEDDAQKCLQGLECIHLGIHLADFIRVYCEGSTACKV
jgi:hypothetical protein